MNLMGKVAVVTGAAGGIGRAVAIEMASQGAAVVLSDVRAEPLERTVRELLERGLEVNGSVADITTPAGNQQLVATRSRAISAASTCFTPTRASHRSRTCYRPRPRASRARST